MNDEICEECGQEPPQTADEKWSDKIRSLEDMFVHGVSMECVNCGSRMNPIEHGDVKTEKKDSDEVKFLDSESLKHGME